MHCQITVQLLADELAEVQAEVEPRGAARAQVWLEANGERCQVLLSECASLQDNGEEDQVFYLLVIVPETEADFVALLPQAESLSEHVLEDRGDTVAIQEHFN